MSEIYKKELASALKWTWVIVITALAYHWVAPKYYFKNQQSLQLRGNIVTGQLDELGDYEWRNISGKE